MDKRDRFFLPGEAGEHKERENNAAAVAGGKFAAF